MTDDETPEPAADSPPGAYQPPTVQRLGTLRELTLGGGSTAPNDGFGQAGDMGSIG